MSISAEEFATLQVQLLELKQWKYEYQEKERKAVHDIKVLREQNEKYESELRKANNVISKSKDKKEYALLLDENENMMRNLQMASQEHRDQQEAMLQNVKDMFGTNKALEEEVARLKEEVAKSAKQLEEQQMASLKLQIKNAELETAAPHEKEEFSENGITSYWLVFTFVGEVVVSAVSDGERERNRETIRLLGSQLKAMEENFAKATEDHAATVAELEAQLAAVRDKSKQDSINAARREEVLAEDNNKLKEDISTILANKENLITQLAGANDLKSISAKQAEELNAERATTAELRETVDNLQSNCNNYKTEVRELFLKCQSLESKLAEQTQNNATLTTTNLDLDAKLKLLTEDKDALETKYITFQHEQEKKIAQLQADAAAKLEAVQSGAAAKLEKIQSEAAATLEKHQSEATAKFEKAQANFNAYFEKARNENVNKLGKEQSDHAAKVEAMENDFKSRFETLKAEHSEKFTKLQSEHTDTVQQLYETKGLLEEQTVRAEELSANLASASGDVERLSLELAETQKQRDEAIASLESLQIRLNVIEEEYSTYKTDTEAIRADTESLQQQLEEAMARAVVAETSAADKDTEMKILERKNQRMIKELKAELQKERTNTPSKLHHSSTELNLSSTNLLGTPVLTSSPSMPQLSVPPTPPHNAPSTPTTPTVATPRLAQPSFTSSTEEVLRSDLETLAKKVGEMGTEKWKLEEKIRFLEENIGLLNDELDKKSQVVQYYISRSNPNLDHTTQKNKTGVVGGFLRASDPALAAQLLAKMEAVLQETILKNIQLQKDLETMANELTRADKKT